MSGYRRFIAYVYEYHKGKKSGNCGFIKVEIRNQQCRIETHLHCPGLPPQVECKVYGIVRRDGLMNGILLGTCETETDTAECLIETDAMNMAGSGISFGKMGAMILMTQTGVFFGTEWDDQIIRPDNFREMPMPVAEAAVPVPAMPQPKPLAAPDEAQSKSQTVLEEATQDPLSFAEVSDTPPSFTPGMPDPPPMLTETKNASSAIPASTENEPQPEPNTKLSSAAEPDTELSSAAKPETAPEIGSQSEPQPEPEPQPNETFFSPESPVPSKPDTSNLTDSETPTSDIPANHTQPDGQPTQDTDFSQEAPTEPVTSSDLKKQDAASAVTEFAPFDDLEFIRCWRIQPADLARISPRARALRSNRFLQYGYYNFGHLLLAQRSGGRFILGVPGGYDQQERFMAGMFGFPYFKECRQIELPGNRGGYWYRLIDAPNFN